MKISQNPCVRLTSEQFSRLADAKSYPGMYSLCLFMRFRKIPTEGCVRACPRKIEIFTEFRLFAKLIRDGLGSF